MEKQYSTFTVKTNIASTITLHNYYKSNISVYDKAGRYAFGLSALYLSLDMYTDIFSGDEKAAKEAIDMYVKQLKNKISCIENLMAI